MTPRGRTLASNLKKILRDSRRIRSSPANSIKAERGTKPVHAGLRVARANRNFGNWQKEA